MFCKKCGNEIEDDSIFCKYCGHKVMSTLLPDEGMNEDNLSNDTNATPDNDPTNPNKISDNEHKNTKWIYIIWFLTNCALWIIASTGDSYYKAGEYFIIGNHEPSLDYYDGTEFMLFTFILPGILLSLTNITGAKALSLLSRWSRNNKVRWLVSIIVSLTVCLTAYSCFLYLGLTIALIAIASLSLILSLISIRTNKGKAAVFFSISLTAFTASWFSHLQHRQYQHEQESLGLYYDIYSHPTVEKCMKYLKIYSSTSNANKVYNKLHYLLLKESEDFKYYSSDILFDGTTITPLQEFEDFANIALENNNMEMHDKAINTMECICDSLYEIACEYNQVHRWRKYYAFAPDRFKRDSEAKVRDACIFFYNKCYNENNLNSWILFRTSVPDSLIRDADERIETLCDIKYKDALVRNNISTWKKYIESVPAEFLKDSKSRISVLCDSMYSAAISMNNYKEWNKYINTVPEEYIRDSRERIIICIWKNQDTAWEYACDKNTIESYKAYLKHFPHGKNADTAQKRIIDKTVSKAFYKNHRVLPNIECDRFLDPAFYIWNGSSYNLKLYISGPTSKIIELKSSSHTEVHLRPGNYCFYAILMRDKYGTHDMYGAFNFNTIATYVGKATLKNLHYSIHFR